MLEQETIRLQIEHETFTILNRVMRCFDLIPTDLIDRTIRSMPTWIKHIIALKGARIKY